MNVETKGWQPAIAVLVLFPGLLWVAVAPQESSGPIGLETTETEVTLASISTDPWIIGPGEKVTLQGGTYYWDQPIVVQPGGILEFLDINVVANFSREEEEGLSERINFLTNGGSVYVNSSVWYPYTYMPDSKPNILYYLKEWATPGVFHVENSTIKVDERGAAPLWMQSGRLRFISSTLVNITVGLGTLGSNTIHYIREFRLQDTSIWENRTDPTGIVSHLGQQHIQGASSKDRFNLTFQGVLFNGFPFYGGTIGPGENIVLNLGTGNVGGIHYVQSYWDTGDISITGGNFTEGMGIRFYANRNGSSSQAEEGSVGDITIKDTICYILGRGRCSINADTWWTARNLTISNISIHSTSTPTGSTLIEVGSNASIRNVRVHGNTSEAFVAGGENIVIRDNHLDGVGSYDFRQSVSVLEIEQGSSNVTFSDNVIGNISSSGAMVSVIQYALQPVDNITIANNYFGNITPNGGLGENIWVIGFYSGFTPDPGSKYNKNIRITNNYFLNGPKLFGWGYHELGTGCLCGAANRMPWQLWIDNNTFIADIKGSQVLTSNYGSTWIKSRVENNTIIGKDGFVPFRLQANHDYDILTNNSIEGANPYYLDAMYPRANYTLFLRNHYIDERLQWRWSVNKTSVVLDGVTMKWLNATSEYYEPQFSFANHLVTGQLGVEYQVDTSRWISETASVRYGGFAATVPNGTGWLNLTMLSWSPGAEDIVASWRAESTGSTSATFTLAFPGVPNAVYDILLDGELWKSTAAGSDGTVSFEFRGPWPPHTFVVTRVGVPPPITPPITPFLIDMFNVSLSYDLLSSDLVRFNAAIAPIAPYTFLWDFGDGSLSNEQSPTHQYQFGLSGSFDVRVTICNESACTVLSQQVTLMRWDLLALLVAIVLITAVFNLVAVQRARNRRGRG